MLHQRRVAFALFCCMIGLSACGGGGSSSVTPAVPHAAAGSNDPAAPQHAQRLYIPNSVQNSIVIQDAGANENAPFLASITGTQTKLAAPVAVAVDTAGNIYAANVRCNCVTEYSATAFGDTAPVADIEGSNTGLNDPEGIAIDIAGNIYVANRADSRVTVYARGSTGNVAPVRTLEGSATGLCRPRGIAVSADGTLYVINTGNIISVTAYNAGAAGDAKPRFTIQGIGSRLNNPSGLAVSQSDMYVTNMTGGAQRRGSVTEYALADTGRSKPAAIISGSDTHLDKPAGIALDAAGQIYVSNTAGSPDITVYSASATDNAAPTRVIEGANTGVCSPGLIAVAQASATVRYHLVALPAGFGAAAMSRSGKFLVGRMSGMAALYSNGSVVSLGTLRGDNESYGSAVNDSGFAVGDSIKEINAETFEHHPVRFMNGSVTSLAGNGVVITLNDSNEAGGYTIDPVTGDHRATFWNAQNVAEFPLQDSPEYTNSIIEDVNLAGQFAGVATVSNVSVGFFGSGLRFLPLRPPAPLGDVYGLLLNDAGDFAGGAKLGFHNRAFLRFRSGETILSPFPGDLDTEATGINDSDQVVGDSYNPQSRHPYIYQSGHMIDLNSLVSGVTLYSAQGIDDHGDILASDARNQYLLVPCAGGKC